MTYTKEKKNWEFHQSMETDILYNPHNSLNCGSHIRFYSCHLGIQMLHPKSIEITPGKRRAYNFHSRVEEYQKTNN